MTGTAPSPNAALASAQCLQQSLLNALNNLTEAKISYHPLQLSSVLCAAFPWWLKDQGAKSVLHRALDPTLIQRCHTLCAVSPRCAAPSHATRPRNTSWVGYKSEVCHMNAPPRRSFSSHPPSSHPIQNISIMMLQSLLLAASMVSAYPSSVKPGVSNSAPSPISTLSDECRLPRSLSSSRMAVSLLRESSTSSRAATPRSAL